MKFHHKYEVTAIGIIGITAMLLYLVILYSKL